MLDTSLNKYIIYDIRIQLPGSECVEQLKDLQSSMGEYTPEKVDDMLLRSIKDSGGETAYLAGYDILIRCNQRRKRAAGNPFFEIRLYFIKSGDYENIDLTKSIESNIQNVIETVFGQSNVEIDISSYESSEKPDVKGKRANVVSLNILIRI